MKFDKLIQAPCILTPLEELTCPIDIPSGDERCSDVAFALTHPELCQFYPILKIRPDISTICTGGNITFKTYLYSNGVEFELTSGLIYTTSDRSVVVIGAISGSATGIAQGIANVGVTWQKLSATAQLQVMPGNACCEDINTGMLLVLDNSASMGLQFSPTYGTKMAYAKLLATHFADSINISKDFIGTSTFNEAFNLFCFLDQDLDWIKQCIAVTSVSDKRTSIYESLEESIAYLKSSSLSRRVIVLITDGEQRGDEIRDPVPVANAFKESGGIIMVVGVRAYGAGFDLLERIASSGFFLNAYPRTEEETFDYLVGLKGYICGTGECAPPGNTIDSIGQLNYAAFFNWDVTGKVDLIGEGTGGEKLFDLLPGNGLYVDLCGTVGLGKLTSKTAFTLENGVNYKISYLLAGNQRENRSDSVRVKVGTLSDETISFDSSQWILDFAEHSDEFVGDGGTHQVSFEQGDIGIGGNMIGTLLDLVKLENLDDGTILLLDTFDNENRHYVPPGCGTSYYGDNYYQGYDCYGCLDGPIPVQRPDPNESIDIESDEPPPVQFTSTQEYTAECESPSTGDSVTKFATASSSVSQADADKKATAEARLLAEDDLDCTIPKNGTAIIIPEIGAASPYPSILNVSGVTGTIKKMTVQILGFTHDYPRDVDILLISPTGKTCMLLSDSGANHSVVGVNILFDDNAAGSAPETEQLGSGPYKPTNYGASDNDIPPAPPGPYGSTLAVFNGQNPNGAWYLYVVDDTELDGGLISSWKINFTT